MTKVIDDSFAGKHHKTISDGNIVLCNNEQILFLGIAWYKLKKHFLNKQLYDAKLGVPFPTLGFTDGENITYLIDDKFNLDKYIFISLHEVLHCVSRHVSRRGDRNPYIWNLATDHIINNILEQTSHDCTVVKPDSMKDKNGNGIVLIEDLVKLYPNADAEEIYDLLKKQVDKNKIKIKVIGKLGNGNCNGNGNNGNGSGSGNNRTQSKDNNKSGGSGVQDLEVVEIEFPDGSKKRIVVDRSVIDSTEKESKAIDNETEFYNDLKRHWEMNTLNKGDTPGAFATYLDEIFKVEIPWHEVLEEAILYSMQIKKRRTWNFPNIVIRCVRLPGKAGNDTNPYTLVAVIDSSGSVGDDDLKQFAGVILGCVPHFKNLRVIIHDYDIQDEIEFSTHLSEIEIVDRLSQIRGRGGTSHKEVFESV